MASQVMRITLKAYDHQLVDASAKKIIETVKKNGSQVSGPVPLPTKKEVVTILRAVHTVSYTHLRMVIRMSAGDLNAWVALIGFALGVATGLSLIHI